MYQVEAVKDSPCGHEADMFGRRGNIYSSTETTKILPQYEDTGHPYDALARHKDHIGTSRVHGKLKSKSLGYTGILYNEPMSRLPIHSALEVKS